ncbi:MAG: homocysteine S-methyltransferase family protein [Deltaproteobacteria bacterium]|nr:homocysteine S-methyltransferase family protein [Deltaproteobacteria bacterium]
MSPAERPCVLDGPMGTMLAERGVETPAPLWSAHALEVAPDVVASIHRAYADAGATVHTTATFRTQRRHAGARWRSLVHEAVRLARDAVPATHRVAGSVAPLEDCYEPSRSPGAAAFAEHAELADALAEEGVDLLLCEAFPRVDEALAALAAARRTGLPVWLSFTAGPSAELLTPSAIAQGARRARDLGADVVLVNCTAAALCEPYAQALAAASVPWGIYANVGRPSDGFRDAPDEEGPSRHARLAARWIERGTRVVGGCCGMTPRHVAAVAAVLARS